MTSFRYEDYVDTTWIKQKINAEVAGRGKEKEDFFVGKLSK
jgi:hypothetical protein